MTIQTAKNVNAGSNLIVASLVKEENRMKFLPRLFSRHFMELEMNVYHQMSTLCEDYNGGYWEFYELSNQGGYLGLDKDDTYHLQVPGNYFDGELSGDGAGVVATLFALSRLAESTGSELLCDRYHELLEFSRSHEEAGLISSAID